MFNGIDTTRAAVGRNVTSFVRVVPTQGTSSPSLGTVDAVSPTMLYLSAPSQSSRFKSACYCVDEVWGAKDFGASTTDMLGRVLPLALGVIGGVSSSVIHCHAAANAYMPQPEWDKVSFFDPQSKRCIALTLLERLVEEATKAGRPSYLSMGAITGVHPREKVCDIIGSDAQAMKPLQVSARPSLVHEAVFDAIKEVNVSYGRRCSEVFFEGLRSLIAFQGRYSISKSCTIFASIAVPLESDLQTVSTFTVIDICDVNVMRTSLLLSPSADDPYLGSDAVSLLSYGLRLSNSALLISTVSNQACEEDVACLAVASEARKIVTTPHDVAAELQDLSKIQEALRVDDSDECRLFADARELMRHRAMVNETLAQSQTQSVLFEQLQHDFSNLADTLKRTQNKIVDALPEVLHDLQSDTNTSRVLAARFEAIKEMEYMQERERRRLSLWQAELANIPVRRESGLATVDADSRTMLLEGTVRTLQEENDRLRALFNRDIRILRVELDVAKSQAGAGKQGAKSREFTNPLQPLIDAFSEECTLLLRGALGTRSSLDNSALLPQLCQLMDTLASDFKFNADVLLSDLSRKGGAKAASPGIVPQLSTSMSDEALFVQAALDRSRRVLGIPVAPPKMGSAFDPPSFTYWRAMVEERAMCRSERWSLQHMSKGLGLTATRLVEGLSRLDTHLQSLGSAISSFSNLDAHQKSYKNVSKAQAEVNRLIGEEMGLGSASLTMNAASSSALNSLKQIQDEWGLISLQIQRCSELALLLKGSSVVMHQEDLSNFVTPLSFELAEEVRNAIEGVSELRSKEDVPKIADTSTLTVSLDGILKGSYRKPGLSAGPTQKGHRQGKVVTQGFFSEIARN